MSKRLLVCFLVCLFIAQSVYFGSMDDDKFLQSLLRKKKKQEKGNKKIKGLCEEKNQVMMLLLIAAFLLVPLSQNTSATLCSWRILTGNHCQWLTYKSGTITYNVDVSGPTGYK